MYLWPVRIFMICCLCFCLAVTITADEEDEWQTSTPEAQDVDGDLLAAMMKHLEDEEMFFMDGILIVQDGVLIFEEYFSGFDADTVHEVRSVSKSVTSAVVGIALENDDIESLDITFAEFFPEYFEDDANADKTEITLRDLLMMRSGLDWQELRMGIAREGQSNLDQLQQIIRMPLATEPGETFSYSTADTHLISAIIQAATGLSVAEYAEEHLFEPLGIETYRWATDPHGYTIAGAELSLRPRDMAKIGQLYLQSGEWDDEQLIPADWVEVTTAPQDDDVPFYGYHWWITPNGLFWAEGWGGQLIIVIPGKQTIIVTTASSATSPAGIDERQEQIFSLVAEYILPALPDVEASMQETES